MENFVEVQDVNEVNAETGTIVNEAPVETEVKGTEQETKKPGKFKSFVKGTWNITKKVMPIGLAYSLGYATKAAIGKFAGKPAVVGSDVPAIPVKTETIDLGEGVSAEVTNF